MKREVHALVRYCCLSAGGTRKSCFVWRWELYFPLVWWRLRIQTCQFHLFVSGSLGLFPCAFLMYTESFIRWEVMIVLSISTWETLNRGEGQLFILFSVYLISLFFNGFTLRLLIAPLLYHVSLLQFWYNFLLYFHLGILGCHSFFAVMSWYMYMRSPTVEEKFDWRFNECYPTAE